MTRLVAIVGLVAGLLVLSPANAAAQIKWGRPRTPAAGACFYEDINFGGQYFCTAAGTSAQQVPYGVNDQISSIKIFGKASVLAFRDINFKGPSKRFEEDMRDLRKAGWNDRITSYRVESNGIGGGLFDSGPSRKDTGVGLQAYDAIKFGGKSATFISNVPDLRSAGMAGSISSLRVPQGQSWQVCTEINYQGRCRVVTSDVNDLRSGQWNDVIYSVRRVR